MLREELVTGEERGSLQLLVPTRGISDGTFCEFYIGLRTFRDHYICKKSTV